MAKKPKVKKRPKLLKQPKRLPKHTRDLVKKLTRLFALENYDRSFQYPKEDYEGTAASVHIEEDYQRVCIKLYPVFFKDSAENQKKYLLHEFCHTITHELVNMCDKMINGTFISRDQIKTGCERTTSKATIIIENLLLGYEPAASSAYRTFGTKKKAVKKK